MRALGGRDRKGMLGEERKEIESLMLEEKGWNKGNGGFEDGGKRGGVVNEEKGNERVRSLGRKEKE